MKKRKHKKIRVNITVDEELINKAKTKLNLFGGKLSTLFNSYLSDFVESIERHPRNKHDILLEEIEKLKIRLKKIEQKLA
ncbi:MAG: hypothetical protein AABX73_00570 [Nanoarchaeota archaeon]